MSGDLSDFTDLFVRLNLQATENYQVYYYSVQLS